MYVKIQLKLGTFRPTIGYCALHSVLQTEFAELYITGFTFFKTAFGDGYRNDIKEAHQAQQFIKQAGLHNPELEYREFFKIIQASTSKNIIMDDTLKEIIRTNLILAD
jgi:hypothetical protein